MKGFWRGMKLDAGQLFSRHWVVMLVAVGSLGIGNAARAADVQWVNMSAWTTDATSGTFAYKAGTVQATLSPSIGNLFSLFSGFATDSASYENIDSIPLGARFINGTADWTLTFDFVGTTLTSDDAFALGQLFIFNGTPNTQITLSAFGVDDTTPFPLATLDFEQHGIPSQGFVGQLDWDPNTGLLRPTSIVNENSAFGFFSPSSGEIGKLILSADTITDQITIGLAIPIPEPGSALLVGLSLLGALALRRRK